MAYFEAKIGWKKLGKWENKIFHSVSFILDALQKISKKLEKNSKNKKIQLWLHLKPKQVGKSPRKEENKNFLSISFLPGAQQKIPKKQQKNCKN